MGLGVRVGLLPMGVGLVVSGGFGLVCGLTVFWRFWLGLVMWAFWCNIILLGVSGVRLWDLGALVWCLCGAGLAGFWVGLGLCVAWCYSGFLGKLAVSVSCGGWYNIVLAGLVQGCFGLWISIGVWASFVCVLCLVGWLAFGCFLVIWCCL